MEHLRVVLFVERCESSRPVGMRLCCIDAARIGPENCLWWRRGKYNRASREPKRALVDTKIAA
jgi:hypothetical protein